MKKNHFVSLAILVAALGYFVDIYDLLLFGIVRIDSLKDLGIAGDQLNSDGEFILSVQMFGLLIGGIIWGVMGDNGCSRKAMVKGSSQGGAFYLPGRRGNPSPYPVIRHCARWTDFSVK